MHTYRGPNGLIINHNGDFSGMAILRYQGTEIEISASEIAPYVEQERIVREIAAKDENDWLPDGILIAVGGPVFDVSVCCFCGAKIFGDDATIEAHEPDCLFVRSRAIVARLDGGTSNE